MPGMTPGYVVTLSCEAWSNHKVITASKCDKAREILRLFHHAQNDEHLFV